MIGDYDIGIRPNQLFRVSYTNYESGGGKVLKKIIISLVVLLLIVVITVFTITNKKDSSLQKVKVAEVTHSVFYAPQYLAHALGYFEEEGLDVEINLVPGADKVTAAVLSGDANIGLCGSEATIYVYNQGEKDYLVTFAGLTKKDGSFIVSREKYDDFKLSDMKGKSVIGGRKGERLLGDNCFIINELQ